MSVAIFLVALWLLFGAHPSWQRFWASQLLLLALFTESFVLMRDSALGFYLLLNLAAAVQGAFLTGVVITALARQLADAVGRFIQA